MSKPTPGPWPITWGPVIDIGGIAFVPIASDGKHTANATLIAAAPELLEAVENLLAYAEDVVADRAQLACFKPGVVQRHVKQAIAAIACATSTTTAARQDQQPTGGDA